MSGCLHSYLVYIVYPIIVCYHALNNPCFSYSDMPIIKNKKILFSGLCFESLDNLPCDFSYQVVESMRLGMEPKLAAKDAISRIARKFPDFVGAVFAINKNGVHAGACHGWTFQYSVRSPEMNDVEVFTVLP